MKLDPNAKEEERGDFPVYPEGDYDFEVENVTYQQNKKKDAYQYKVQFRIDAEGGKSFKVWEYFKEVPSQEWKFTQFFKSIGRYNVTDSSEMKNVIREIGRCHIVIDPAKDGYKEKNKIDRYYPMPQTQEPEINPDDLPF